MANGNGDVPDMLGLEIAEARRRLETAGVREVGVVATTPPRGGTPGGNERVVRVSRTGGSCALVVAAFPVLELHMPQESTGARSG